MVLRIKSTEKTLQIAQKSRPRGMVEASIRMKQMKPMITPEDAAAARRDPIGSGFFMLVRRVERQGSSSLTKLPEEELMRDVRLSIQTGIVRSLQRLGMAAGRISYVVGAKGSDVILDINDPSGKLDQAIEAGGQLHDEITGICRKVGATWQLIEPTLIEEA